MAEFVEVMEKFRKICDSKIKCADCPIHFLCSKVYKDFSDANFVEAEHIALCYEPSIDWSKVKVDTPILVNDGKHEEWLRRYFAGYECGYVLAWSDGRTSFTGCGKQRWKNAKLYEGEE